MTRTTTLNDVDLDAVAQLTDTIRSDSEVGHTTWASTSSWKGGFRTESSSRSLPAIPSDEPPALGGTDTASNPVEQLLGALGNCLAVGYAASATAAGIELDELRIEVEGDLDLHTFLGLRPGHAGFSKIEATVHIRARDPEVDLGPIHDHVVSTSPVGHTLAHPVPVEISYERAIDPDGEHA